MIALLVNFSAAPVDDKIRVEDVVLKHLESIGSDQARRSSRSRIAAGSSLMNVRTGGRGNVSGPALIASHEEKVLVKAEFTTASYPFERLGFDGRKFSARQFAPGSRSPLAEFFMSHEAIFSEGLIGGTLSSAWPLLKLSEREPKLQYVGTEKIKGRQAHKVRYTPRNGGELKITLYFDAESFHHLRTDYERVIPAPLGATPGESASQRETRYKLVEDFSDFKREGDLTLPHTYNLQFTTFQTNNPSPSTGPSRLRASPSTIRSRRKSSWWITESARRDIRSATCADSLPTAALASIQCGSPGLSLRSRRKRKAWGVSPRTTNVVSFAAREMGGSPPSRKRNSNQHRSHM